MTQPRGALLVGSVNYDDAEKTMRTAAGMLGGLLRRIPGSTRGRCASPTASTRTASGCLRSAMPPPRRRRTPSSGASARRA
ncbi:MULTISPECIES: hypothetical protein [Microbacterium]|uniref:hypothetical protein n=1 Tax=Microbacterium TaxID=33882 RepID=UPI00217ECF1A|nr:MULTISPECIES: hypothetical protein [Microbacterium]